MNICTLSLKLPQFCCWERHCFGKDPWGFPYLLQVIHPSFSCCLAWLCYLARHPPRGNPCVWGNTVSFLPSLPSLLSIFTLYPKLLSQWETYPAIPRNLYFPPALSRLAPPWNWTGHCGVPGHGSLSVFPVSFLLETDSSPHDFAWTPKGRFSQFSRSFGSNSTTPETAACQASLSITNSWSLLKLMSIQLVMPYNHLILCCPHLLLPQSFPASGSFQMS